MRFKKFCRIIGFFLKNPIGKSAYFLTDCHPDAKKNGKLQILHYHVLYLFSLLTFSNSGENQYEK